MLKQSIPYLFLCLVFGLVIGYLLHEIDKKTNNYYLEHPTVGQCYTINKNDVDYNKIIVVVTDKVKDKVLFGIWNKEDKEYGAIGAYLYLNTFNKVFNTDITCPDIDPTKE